MNKEKFFLGIALIFVVSLGLYRYFSRDLYLASNNRHIYREYDPRGRLVETFRKKTEREYFKIKGHFLNATSYPGLASLDFSLTWLRILASTYDEASVEGDFSWLFHKLRFISSLLPQSDSSFQSAMLPYFVVLGKDNAGALFLFNEKLSQGRDAQDWRVAYWAAFHALENLNNPKLAGYLFMRAAKSAGAPAYLAPMGFRLMSGALLEEDKMDLRREALNRLDPALLEKIKTLKPEWFEGF